MSTASLQHPSITVQGRSAAHLSIFLSEKKKNPFFLAWLYQSVTRFSSPVLFHPFLWREWFFVWNDQIDLLSCHPFNIYWGYMGKAPHRELGMDMYTVLYLKWITRTYGIAHRTLLSVMWQPGQEGSLGENWYICTYGWVPSLFTWNYHNIVNWLYFSTK